MAKGKEIEENKKKRVIQLSFALSELKEELAYLSSFTFNADLFKLRRNYIMGTAIVDELRIKLDLPILLWKGTISDEIIAQHWLFYCMQGIETKFPSLLITVLNKFPVLVHWRELENRVAGAKPSIELLDEELFSIIMEIYPQVITTVTSRLEPMRKVGKGKCFDLN